MDGVADELVANPCRSLCSWHRTPQVISGRPVLACRGCGTQWVRGQAWTPIDADGRIPPEVLAERDRDDSPVSE